MINPTPPGCVDPTLASLLERPSSHLHEATALDRLLTVLGTAEPGSVVLLYGATASDADAVAEAGSGHLPHGAVERDGR